MALFSPPEIMIGLVVPQKIQNLLALLHVLTPSSDTVGALDPSPPRGGVKPGEGAGIRGPGPASDIPSGWGFSRDASYRAASVGSMRSKDLSNGTTAFPKENPVCPFSVTPGPYRSNSAWRHGAPDDRPQDPFDPFSGTGSNVSSQPPAPTTEKSGFSVPSVLPHGAKNPLPSTGTVW